MNYAMSAYFLLCLLLWFVAAYLECRFVQELCAAERAVIAYHEAWKAEWEELGISVPDWDELTLQTKTRSIRCMEAALRAQWERE